MSCFPDHCVCILYYMRYHKTTQHCLCVPLQCHHKKWKIRFTLPRWHFVWWDWAGRRDVAGFQVVVPAGCRRIPRNQKRPRRSPVTVKEQREIEFISGWELSHSSGRYCRDELFTLHYITIKPDGSVRDSTVFQTKGVVFAISSHRSANHTHTVNTSTPGGLPGPLHTLCFNTLV